MHTTKSNKIFLPILLLQFLSVSVLYAHGQHMLIPFTADILVFLVGIAMLFKRYVGWKYRVVIFCGTLFIIWFSWVIVDLIWPRYYHLALDNITLMTFAYYCIVFALFAALYYGAEKYVKAKSI